MLPALPQKQHDMNKAVFLDKDGTLINDIPYNVDPDLIALSDDSVDGLRKLQKAGYKLIIVTNQSGVSRGFFKEASLKGVESRLNELLKTRHLKLDGFYYCPHHPDGIITEYAIACECRKPNPGMLKQSAKEHNIDLHRSWMIGDILNDVEAGNRAGVKSILIDNGNETEWIEGAFRKPVYTAKNINDAAGFILSYLYE